MTDISEEIQSQNDNISNIDKPWLFQKGQSGNPLGRPKGTKNKLTKLLEEVAGDDLQKIVNELVKRSSYRPEWLSLLLKYTVPKPKSYNTCLLEDDAEVTDLKLDTPEDIKKASEMIIKAMIAGRISVAEAEGMVRIVERYGK